MDVKNPCLSECFRDKNSRITNKTTPSKKASYSIDGCLGMLSNLGKITPQEEFVGVPYNSALMKFPILPKNNPIGTYKTMKSVNCRKLSLIDFPNEKIAMITPNNAP